MFPPSRIVCFTEETVETLYSLGEQDRVVGIGLCRASAAGSPREAAREPFTSANIDKILALEPDLVLTFSNLQADIAAELIRLNVHAFNQRTVAGILDMIRKLGAMVDAGRRSGEFVTTLESGLVQAQHRAECLPKRPRVFLRSGTTR
jgi:iron complex transport system substrate-binding protein